jgi:ABC-type nickel/cobalt efflux system permease component RcnA
LSWVAETQQRMQLELAASVRRLKSGNAVTAALALAGLSFIYGVLHAVGPGHGKAIISSYVVANEETVRRGVVISFLAATMQAVTAVVLVSVFLVVLNATGLFGSIVVPRPKRRIAMTRMIMEIQTMAITAITMLMRMTRHTEKIAATWSTRGSSRVPSHGGGPWP